MIISFKGAKSGWAEYVINGTKEKPRDREKVKIIDGDPELTKQIYDRTSYIKNYTSGIISFENKDITEEEIEKIYTDWKKEFLHGYKEDEYNICAVLHLDTEHKHIHFCIPHLNLLTATQNNYYYHKIDFKRASLLQTYLNIKYKETNPIDREKTAFEKDINKSNRINKWKDEDIDDVFNRKKRKEALIELNNFLYANVENETIQSFEDLKEMIGSLDLKIVKTG